ncbi:Protein CapI [Desulfovibrionales bacterium]
MQLLITGTAGFIGYHLALAYLQRGIKVVGLDIVNDYYSVQLKEDRLRQLAAFSNYRHKRIDLVDGPTVAALFQRERFTHVVNLAAQAGVRYSSIRPEVYIQSNIQGFFHILEGCRHHGIEHLVYASSSSVYGLNTSMPFSVHQNVDHPASLYAATKKSNELMAHSYAHLFRLPCTGLRFFTVYGPWGRPDMALFLFTKAIIEGQPINVYNYGKMQRDFTYIDDIVQGIEYVTERTPTHNPHWDSNIADPSTSTAPYRLYNIGNHSSVELNHFIAIIEHYLGRKAIKKLLPIQSGDIPATFADIDILHKDIGFAPITPIEVGIEKFLRWYIEYYNIVLRKV